MKKFCKGQRAMLCAAASCAALFASAEAAAQSTQAAAQPAATEDNPADKSSDDIVVTAQKREQLLREVPVPVAVLNTEALTSTNQVLMRDYVQNIPSVTLATGVQGVQTIVIRGISTGTGNPTTSIMIDGIGFNAATNNGGGRIIPDIDPGDLERIEVLRGPQGTFYGATSLGGAFNYVTRDPSTAAISGEVRAGLTSVSTGHDAGYNVRGGINIPLSDTLAVRASAFSRYDPGFIDDPLQGKRDVNHGRAKGYRASALWKPSSDVSVKLSALDQTSNTNGSPSVDIGAGVGDDLVHRRLRGTGFLSKGIQSYSAAVKVGFGDAQVTSLTNYNKIHIFERDDAAPASTTGNGTAQVTNLHAKKISQELRLDVPLGSMFDLTAGAFYTNEDTILAIDVLAVDRTTGGTISRSNGFDFLTDWSEYAGFANLTAKLTDRFDIQAGARVSKIDAKFGTNDVNHNPVPAQSLPFKKSPITYLLSPRWRVTDNLMVYARFATGFRTGGANAGAGGAATVTAQFNPDQTMDYEVGVKGDFFDHALSIDASLYHIDWKDLQFNQVGINSAGNNMTYTTNGNDAKSEGFEFSATVRPLRGLSFDGWITISDASLTEALPATATAVGPKGSPLPYSTKFGAHLGVRYVFALGNDASANIGGSYNRTGERFGPFLAAALGARQSYPAYSTVNLSVGVTVKTWDLSVFANNVEDTRGIINGGKGVAPAGAYYYITPRVVGFSLGKRF